ncbi:hypothetical protein [Parabacteroides sp.]
MIQADPLCGHFPEENKSRRAARSNLKERGNDDRVLRFGMIRRTSRPEESDTSSKQLKKEVTMRGYYDSG